MAGPSASQAVEVDDNSILGERALRNAYEHFDTELDNWRRSSTQKNLFDRGGFYPRAIKGLDEVDQLRNFDTSNGDLIFQGHRYSTASVVKALSELVDAIGALTARRP